MKPSLAFPIFLIVAGTIWLLRSLHLFPATSDIIALVLTITGVAILVLEGINKQTFITAPMLVYIGGAIYSANHYHIETAILVATGMIGAGCLMLITRSDLIPDPHKNLPKK